MIRIKDLQITADTWKNYDGNGFGEFKARASQVQNFELLDANGDIDPVKLQKLIDTVTYKALLIIKRDVFTPLANTDIEFNIFNAELQEGIIATVLAQAEGLVTDGFLERKNASQVQGGDLSVQEDITGNLLSYDRVYEQAEDEAMAWGLNKIELKYDSVDKIWQLSDDNNRIAIRFASGEKVTQVVIEGTGNLIGKDEINRLVAQGREKVEFIDAVDINDMLVDFDAFIKASDVKAHEAGEIVQVNYKGVDDTYKDVHEDYVFDGVNYLKFTYNIELKAFIAQSTAFLDDLEARKIDGEEAERRFLAKSKDEGNTEMDAAYVEAASKDIATYGKVQDLIKVVADRAGNNETDIFELNSGNFDVNNDGSRIRNIFTELDALRNEADATAADLVTVKADAVALAAEVTALKGRGTYRGTYTSIDDAKAQVLNPNNGDFVAIGNQDPYIEWIYNDSNQTWEQAGIHQTTGKAFFKDGTETSTQSGAANSKAEQKVLDDAAAKVAKDYTDSTVAAIPVVDITGKANINLDNANLGATNADKILSVKADGKIGLTAVQINPLLENYEIIHTFSTGTGTYQITDLDNKPNDFIVFWYYSPNKSASQQKTFKVLTDLPNDVINNLTISDAENDLLKINISLTGKIDITLNFENHPVYILRRKGSE